ncbi:unnamed protein product [Caenorhabditis bovis]|uniref:BTB domain-containing protein n=1 Tax=Caenorhabditis bovis TaxID=2654633 RepID=A0A8S1F1K7_9PELO|nr:unnamed protein product [Caenorhabditis bovis]
MSKFCSDYLSEFATQARIPFHLNGMPNYEHQIPLVTRINNLSWRIILKFDKKLPAKLDFDISISCGADGSTSWELRANVMIRMLVGRQEPLEFQYRFGVLKFDQHCRQCRFNDFRINDRRDESMANGEICVQVVSTKGINVPPIIDPFKRSPELGDVVLKIADNSVLANRKFLSIHSPIFRQMFAASDSRTIYELDDVNFHDFVTVLNLIHVIGGYITDHNVEGLLILARRFEFGFIRRKCEEYLLATIENDAISRIVWADRFGFGRLLAESIDKMKEKAGAAFKETMEFQTLSSHCRLLFLDELVNKMLYKLSLND